MLLRSLEVKPRPASFRQRTLPSLRSRQRARSFFDWASRARTRTLGPQTIGVPLPGPGSWVDQARLLSLSSLSGRLAAALEPFRNGPRHCGQFVAAAAPSSARTNGASASRTIVKETAARRVKMFRIGLGPRSLLLRRTNAARCRRSKMAAMALYHRPAE